jgi:hypothetical protein
MYEYMIVKATNERRLETQINKASAEGWEVVNYAIRPSGGIFFFIVGLFLADHFALIRRRTT